MYICSSLTPRTLDRGQTQLSRDFDRADRVSFGADKVLFVFLAVLATLTFLSLSGNVDLGPLNALSSLGSAGGFGFGCAAFFLLFTNLTILIVRQTAISNRLAQRNARLEDRATKDRGIKKKRAETISKLKQENSAQIDKLETALKDARDKVKEKNKLLIDTTYNLAEANLKINGLNRNLTLSSPINLLHEKPPLPVRNLNTVITQYTANVHRKEDL